MKLKNNSAFYFWIGLIAGLIFLLYPYIGSQFSLIPGDLGDTRFNIFLLEHATQFFNGELDSYWNAGFMYPEKEVISYSDNLLGTAPIYSLYRFLGFGIFSAFQCWFLSITILNYWASFKLARYLFQNNASASIAAFIFTFSMSLASQLNHAQTIPRFAIPLAILFLLQWAKDFKFSYFALASSFVVYQFYCGIYLGFLMILPFLLIFFGVIFMHWQRVKKMLLERINYLKYGGLVILQLSLLYVLFAPYIERSKKGGLYNYDQIAHSIPTIKSYLSTSRGTLYYEKFNQLTDDYIAYWDHWISPGLIVFFVFLFVGMLIVFKLINRKKSRHLEINKQQLLILWAGLITFIVFLRIDQLSIYYFIQKLPGFGSMRSLTRIINVNLLFFGITMAFIFHWIQLSFPNRKNLLYIILLTLLVTDNFIVPSKVNVTKKSIMSSRHELLISKMKHLKHGAIVSYEPDSIDIAPFVTQIDAMLAAQSLHLKCINGYSATSPAGFNAYWDLPNAANRNYWLSNFPKQKINVQIVN